MEANQEYELKVALSPAALDAIERATTMTEGSKAARSVRLRSVYYDTEDLALRRHGLLLRVRSDGSRRIQTIKADGGTLSRGEWEAEIDGETPDTDAAKATPVASLIGRHKLRDRLQPIFTVDVERRTFLVRRGADTVEVALDSGWVTSDKGEERICEAEFEIKEGETRALFDLAREIAGSGAGLLSLVSKGDRGYRLARGEVARPIKTPAFPLQTGLSAGRGAAVIGHACLSAFLENVALLLTTRDAEALHQARVSIRRLRALYALFRPVLEPKSAPGLKAEMKWISDLLGAARDVDVFLAEVLAPAARSAPDLPGFDALEEAFRVQREEAYDTLFSALRSQRFFEMSLALLRRFEGEAAAAGGEEAALQAMREAPLEDFAARALGRRLKALRKKSADLGDLLPERRHEVRIAAKKLRYMIEPFARLAPRRRVKAVLRSLETMQDALGALNDVRVGRGMMKGFAEGMLARDRPDCAALFAAGVIAASGHADHGALIRRATKARKALGRALPMWSS